MNTQDYTGDMDYFQEQLTEKGITKDMLDMSNYAGLTRTELQHIVDETIRQKEKRDGKEM